MKTKTKRILVSFVGLLLLILLARFAPGLLQDTAEVPLGSSSSQIVSSHADSPAVYHFRNADLLNQHYDKHGRDMGFPDAAAYEAAASRVIQNPAALHKTETEDGDGVYYVEETNEFAVLSKDGYIRTYFYPDAGIDYFNRQ